MTDSRTPNIVVADETETIVSGDEGEISRQGVFKREERLILAYQLASLLHRLGVSADVLDQSEIDHLVQTLERGESESATRDATAAAAFMKPFKKAS
jgi:hypothetical protein